MDASVLKIRFMYTVESVIMGLGGSIRYNNGKNQYTQAQMKQRVKKCGFQ